MDANESLVLLAKNAKKIRAELISARWNRHASVDSIAFAIADIHQSVVGAGRIFIGSARRGLARCVSPILDHL